MLSLAFASQTNHNLILFGRGGHGKSEMLKAVIKSLGIEDLTCVKSLGTQTNAEELFGYMDMDDFNRFKIEDSIFNYPIVILEEGLDASPKILAAIKDLLTSGRFQNGKQNVEIATKLVIILTNKNPEEVSNNASIQALMDRFPLKHLLEWDSYGSENYQALFKKVLPLLKIKNLGSFNDRLAELIGQLGEADTFISPRTAIMAAQILSDSAIIAGRKKVIIEDFKSLHFIQGLEEAYDTATVGYEKAKQDALNLDKFYFYSNRVDKMVSGLDFNSLSHIDALLLSSAISKIMEEFDELRIRFEPSSKESHKIDEINDWQEELKLLALSSVANQPNPFYNGSF